MIGVNVTFEYDDDFDRARVIAVAENARGMFEGMPGLRCKFFTFDDKHRRATNFLSERERSGLLRAPTHNVRFSLLPFNAGWPATSDGGHCPALSYSPQARARARRFHRWLERR